MMTRLLVHPMIWMTAALLAAVVLAIWIASAWWGVGRVGSEGYGAIISSGVVLVQYATPRPGAVAQWVTYGPGFGHRPDVWFTWWPKVKGEPGYWGFIVPLWMVLVPLLAVLAASRWCVVRARRWGCTGACLAYGFQRSGMAPSTPCPECGVVAA